MNKVKLLAVICTLVLMTSCFGGDTRTGNSTFTADGSTFNFFGMKIVMDNGFKVNADANKIAEGNVPKGGKITNVSSNATWKSMGIPGIILGLFNEYVIGYTYVQIGGTK